MKTILSIITALLSASVATKAYTRAGSNFATNGSLLDVRAAITAARDGSTIQIPAGTFNWGIAHGAVTIEGKAITLQGSGSGSTIVQVYGSQQGGSVLEVSPSKTGLTRITGITFKGGWGLDISGSKSSLPFRVDNCAFDDGPVIQITLLSLEGNAPGLIDHCKFSSGAASEMIHNNGLGAEDASGWTDDVLPGGPELVYIEDCAFTNIPESAKYFTGCCAIESYYGARTCMRYCTFNYCSVDQHGTPGMIGARWWEFYDNTFYVPPGGNQSFFFALRGGSGVVFNNHMTGGPNTGSGVIELYSDDSVGFPPYGPGAGIFLNGKPSPRSSPAYIWGNDSTMPIYAGSPNIVQGRNFLVSATEPASMIRSQLAADKGGVEYKYVPYPYPYPLRQLGQSRHP
jgi:hypothetical protein